MERAVGTHHPTALKRLRHGVETETGHYLVRVMVPSTSELPGCEIAMNQLGSGPNLTCT
jgi:hypothetical protein